MRILSQRRWAEFQNSLVHLNEESSARDLLSCILSWLKADLELLSHEPFSNYNFFKFIEINENNIPVKYSEIYGKTITHLKNIAFRYKKNNTQLIASFLHGTLEELALLEIDRECVICRENGMRVYIGKHNRVFVYECIVCGHQEFADGSQVTRESVFEVPTTDMLKEAGFIKDV